MLTPPQQTEFYVAKVIKDSHQFRKTTTEYNRT